MFPIFSALVLGLIGLLISYMLANSVVESPGQAKEQARKRKYNYILVGIVLLVVMGGLILAAGYIENDILKLRKSPTEIRLISVFLIYPIVYLLGGYLVAIMGRPNLSKFSTIFFNAQNNN